MNSELRLRWQAGALLLIAFVVGAVTGGTLVYAGVRAVWNIGGAPPGFPPAGRPRLGSAVPVAVPTNALPPQYEALDLTDSQRHQLERLLNDSRPHMDSLLRQTLPELRGASDSLGARMRAVLTPEQRNRLDTEERVQFRVHGAVPP